LRVETRRTREGKVSRRVVVSLDGCRVPDELRKAMAVEVTQRAAGYQHILGTEPDIADWTERVVERMGEAGRLPKPKRVEVAEDFLDCERHGCRRTCLQRRCAKT
jgi:hypothetical protein